MSGLGILKGRVIENAAATASYDMGVDRYRLPDADFIDHTSKPPLILNPGRNRLLAFDKGRDGSYLLKAAERYYLYFPGDRLSAPCIILLTTKEAMSEYSRYRETPVSAETAFSELKRA